MDTLVRGFSSKFNGELALEVSQFLDENCTTLQEALVLSSGYIQETSMFFTIIAVDHNKRPR